MKKICSPQRQIQKRVVNAAAFGCGQGVSEKPGHTSRRWPIRKRAIHGVATHAIDNNGSMSRARQTMINKHLPTNSRMQSEWFHFSPVNGAVQYVHPATTESLYIGKQMLQGQLMTPVRWILCACARQNAERAGTGHRRALKYPL